MAKNKFVSNRFNNFSQKNSIKYNQTLFLVKFFSNEVLSIIPFRKMLIPFFDIKGAKKRGFQNFNSFIQVQRSDCINLI
jgi:hypothetical protein